MDALAEKVINSMLGMQRYPWEQGFCAQALYEAGRKELWIPMARDAVRRQSPDGRLAMIGGDAAVSDPASCGEVCLRAWEETGEQALLDGAARMRDYLLTAAPRTADGVICHNTRSFHPGYSPRQLWIDGLYMVPPFLAAMGEWAETEKQLNGYLDALYDPERKLFRHIRDMDSRCFVRECFWATGNGWALMGLARIIDAAGEKQEARSVRETALRVFGELLPSVAACRSEDGRLHDILDDPKTFPDGTSTLMASAAVWRAVCGGYAPAGLTDWAEKAYETVRSRIDGWGLLHEVCGCPDFLTPGTSAEAQAAYLTADTWRRRAAEKDSK